MGTFSLIGAALCLCSIVVVPHTSALAISNNVTDFQSNVDDFFKSITKIASLNDKKFNQVSQRITEIGIKLNQSTSKCYEEIIFTLNNGFNTSWSSKRK